MSFSLSPTSTARRTLHSSARQSKRYSDFIDDFSGDIDDILGTRGGGSTYGIDVELAHYEDATRDNYHNEDIEKPEKSSLVDWLGPDDKANPQNWPVSKKLRITMVIALATLVVAFSSSVLSSGTQQLAEEYHVSTTVATLNLSLNLAGFIAGPWVWGPASEFSGRYWPFLIGYVGFMCFTVGIATAQNLYTVLICRFMQCAWGVAPNTVIPGMLVDMWDSQTRPLMSIAWVMTVIMGPTLGPIVGSFTVLNEDLGWRWTMWITLIIAGAAFLLFLVCVEETSGPVILQKKAAKLRFETKDWSLHALRDEAEVSVKTLLYVYGLKPWQMMLQEPILLVMTLYTCFVYGIIYLTLEAFPYSFGVVRGWKDGISSLPFLSLLIGYIVSAIVMLTVQIKFTNKKIAKGQKVSPEDQLPVMILGTFMLIIGFFWFAWTSSPSITWVPQMISGGFIGCGITLAFIPCLTYLIECYLMNANSALAANSILRGLTAAGFPLFATPMYHNLGVNWATSVLGFLVLAFSPATIILYIYGERIRSWSKYVPDKH